MKFLRALGVFVSVILSIAFTASLFALIVASSVARVTSTESLKKIADTVMADEAVTEEIKTAFVYAGVAELLTEEDLDILLTSPAIRDGMAEIIGETITIVTSSDLNAAAQEARIPEIVSDMIKSEPEITEKMATNLVNKALNSDSENLFSLLPQEELKDFLTAPAVVEGMADIMTQVMVASLPQTENPELHISATIMTMIDKESDRFDAIFEGLIEKEGLSYEEFYNEAKEMASETNFSFPNYGASVSEIYRSLFRQYGDLLDQKMMNELRNSTSDDGEPVFPDEIDVMATEDSASSDSDTIPTFLLSVFRVLSSPLLFVIAMLAVLLSLYLLVALFTFSFKKPLLYCGISLVCASVISCFVMLAPVDWLMGLLAEGTESAIVPALISAVWKTFRGNLMTTALICFVTSILMIVGYALLPKAKQAPEAVSEPVAA